MADVAHAALVGGAASGIHVSHEYTYADAAARTGASGFAAGDVGKIAKQTDTLEWWILAATTPVWKRIVVLDAEISLLARNVNRTPGAYPYTIVAADLCVHVDTGGAARSIQLPAPSTFVGVVYLIDEDGNAGVNNVTLLRNASESINGVAASYVISAPWFNLRISSNGTNWFVG